MLRSVSRYLRKNRRSPVNRMRLSGCKENLPEPVPPGLAQGSGVLVSGSFEG